MTELYEYLLDHVFGGFIKHDPALLKDVEEFSDDIRVADNVLEFTLPALFQFTCDSFERHHTNKTGFIQNNNSRKRYLQFRKSLYNNPTNESLLQQGGFVEVKSAHKDHNKTIYMLIHTK